ncbi:peptidylprolyl isomerase [Nocardioides sp. InS609-2]|uniref:peptidylprolyl isomerase n=1 Tax=Nocardioides sp. InS609-2 TaxID=2760705 RepID=UPI0020BE0184|nr:peptidylprolyl isomerase [Nocardioides sp. InS609-2]
MRVRILAPLVSVVVLPFLLVACGGDDDDDGGAGVACDYPEDSVAASKDVDPPPDKATVKGDVAVTFETSIGALEMTMDADAAPCTVGSIVSLAEQGYFDSTSCHRLTTSNIFVLQCGDPTATGGGGPGYTIPDEFTGEETYPAGTLAMANKKDQPNSGGSQFFIVYDKTQLPSQYTVFGTIDETSLDAIRRLAANGTTTGSPDGPPKTPVEIRTVTIS